MSNPYASPEQHSDGQPSAAFAKEVRGLQVVTAALAFGAFVALAVMLFTNGGEIDGEPDITSWIGLGMAGLLFVNHLIIPGVIVRNQLNVLSSESLKSLSHEEKLGAVMGPMRGGHVIACAMLEGAVFMNLVFYMLTSYLGNLIAAVVLIVLIVLKIPTVVGMHNKVMDRLREIEMR